MTHINAALHAMVDSREVADMRGEGCGLDEVEQVVDAQRRAFLPERATCLLH
ncbi:hypothetical protein ACEPT7_03565 [Burkholderia ubonensis]|uniref:hypothetical protein n=1 Tax=Burkholderia ubonensis TaxID=101571 RepID=UPI00358E653E